MARRQLLITRKLKWKKRRSAQMRVRRISYINIEHETAAMATTVCGATAPGLGDMRSSPTTGRRRLQASSATRTVRSRRATRRLRGRRFKAPAPYDASAVQRGGAERHPQRARFRRAKIGDANHEDSPCCHPEEDTLDQRVLRLRVRFVIVSEPGREFFLSRRVHLA